MVIEGNFIKYPFILGAVESKSLSANRETIYIETLEQKDSSPKESGTEVMRGAVD